ncbi:MAG: hypothetical protein JO306_02085 [Gemmatimonadetes bacterium]|nr:hypothetical protein [Gemmatimonadota bacterium]
MPRPASTAPRSRPEPAFNDLLSSTAGGAMLGASLAGKAGAVVGALVGVAVAMRLASGQRAQGSRGPGIQP